MISVEHLTKVYKTTKPQPGLTGFIRNIFDRQYKETSAVEDISFKIEEGELVGFLGPNGAGKTTTMKMLAGILYPTSGTIRVLGHTPFDKKPSFLKHIAFIMGQRNQLLWELPAMDTLKLNQAIYEISDKKFKNTVGELSELLDADDFINQPVKTLSLGQRMKMELIAALLHMPKVLFLDEPTIGLDVIAQKTIRDFIQEYQRRYKATILLTSHYMEDVRHLAKRVIIIDHGALIYDGSFQELINSYANEKRIEVVVDEMPKTDELKKIPFKAHVNFPKIMYRASRSDLPKLVHDITEHISFSDMSIEEEKIEEVVRKIFVRSSKHS